MINVKANFNFRPLFQEQHKSRYDVTIAPMLSRPRLLTCKPDRIIQGLTDKLRPTFFVERKFHCQHGNITVEGVTHATAILLDVDV
jgi:hypothetical protein